MELLGANKFDNKACTAHPLTSTITILQMLYMSADERTSVAQFRVKLTFGNASTSITIQYAQMLSAYNQDRSYMKLRDLLTGQSGASALVLLYIGHISYELTSTNFMHSRNEKYPVLSLCAFLFEHYHW